jgi:acetyl esterase
MAVKAPRLSRVPVWIWRALMARVAPGELKRFSAEPIEAVNYTVDVDYVGAGMPQQRLDVIAPRDISVPLPVYIYFHGGGWTSGDKAALTRYGASQALAGMVVVNVNYRTAPRFHMHHMLSDATAVSAWVVEHIADFGGDPRTIILGGDSAGGQIAALLAATTSHPELAEHYGLEPALAASSVRGVVQHCSIVDFSVIFERGFILGLGFVRMLLPGRGKGESLHAAARYLSPIEWVDATFPPVLVTTSRKDFFYRANLNFIDALIRHGVTVEALIDDEAPHTWQQDSRHPGSSAVYERLSRFVHSVSRSTQSAPA